MSSFKPYDMPIEIDGMGIVFYSTGAVADIPEGSDFLTNSYTRPEQVAEHIRKGDVVGFCTGSGGSFILKFREGYPPEEMCADTAIRLAIDVQGGKLCVDELFLLSEWS
ncbi:MAG: hypothetical protein E7559_10840, partial [Ruminococcaceae bacterium]|nr:hypothetical protein [Oscillospiraceae bacterium]